MSEAGLSSRDAADQLGHSRPSMTTSGQNRCLGMRASGVRSVCRVAYVCHCAGWVADNFSWMSPGRLKEGGHRRTSPAREVAASRSASTGVNVSFRQAWRELVEVSLPIPAAQMPDRRPAPVEVLLRGRSLQFDRAAWPPVLGTDL
jgi:hypothetical protein